MPKISQLSSEATLTGAELVPIVQGGVTEQTTATKIADTLSNNVVTNAKLADMAQSTVKGRAAGAGTGDPVDLTATQATAILDAVVGDSGAGGTKGLVPAPSAGDAAAGKFLKADGTFAVPPNVAFVERRADITGLTISSTVDTIVTGGFATDGDGGHDILVRSVANPGLAAGFQIQDAGGAYWKRAARRTIFAQQVGVVADGTTNDRTSIQDALDYIATTLSGAATLILPAGDIVSSGGDITISSSDTECVGMGYATKLQLATGTSCIIHHATVEVNRSAFRNMTIARGAGGTTSDIGIQFKRTRRCQVTDLFFVGWAGTCIKLGDQAGTWTAAAPAIHRVRGTGDTNSLHGIWFNGDNDSGDVLISDVHLDPATGATNGGNGIRLGGANVGQVDGLQVSNCLFTAFTQGLQIDAPAGGGVGNATFNNVIFDSGVEAGAGNSDCVLISVSGGTINAILFNNCKFNAYHTTGTKVNFRASVSSGAIAELMLNNCRFYNSYTNGLRIEQTGGTFKGVKVSGCVIDDGSRASAGGHSAFYATGDIDDIISIGNVIRHGSGNNWQYGQDFSNLTGDVPYIGPNQIQNAASGHTALAAAHTTSLNALFWAADGEQRVLSEAKQNWQFSGDISPAQITANQNDYNPTGLSTATVLRLSSDASRNITSIAGGSDGRILILHNVGAQDIVLTDDDGATGTAANRFALTANITMAADAVTILQYDSTSSRWRAVGGSGGIADNAVTDAKLRDSAALSVIGRSANSIGDPADIAAATDGHVLRRNASVLGFGTIAATGSLSDYEEGSWTPVIRGSTTAGTQTYSLQIGRYIKIANLVFYTCGVVMTAKDAATAGDLQLSGLPFTTRNLANLQFSANVGIQGSFDLNAAGGYYGVSAITQVNSTYMTLFEVGDNVAHTQLTAADLNNASLIVATGFYFIN